MYENKNALIDTESIAMCNQIVYIANGQALVIHVRNTISPVKKSDIYMYKGMFVIKYMYTASHHI